MAAPPPARKGTGPIAPCTPSHVRVQGATSFHDGAAACPLPTGTSVRTCVSSAVTPLPKRRTSICTCARTQGRSPSSAISAARPSAPKVRPPDPAAQAQAGASTEPRPVPCSQPGQAQPHPHGRAALQLRVLRAALHGEGAPPEACGQPPPGGPSPLLPDLWQDLQRYLAGGVLREAGAPASMAFLSPLGGRGPCHSPAIPPAAVEQLRVHVRRHKGVRKFECTECGYKFTRQVGRAPGPPAPGLPAP